MPRMKPEKYLAWAKKRAIRHARKGYPLQAANSISKDLVRHPLLQDHPSIDKTHAMVDPIFDDQPIDMDEFIRHLKEDY